MTQPNRKTHSSKPSDEDASVRPRSWWQWVLVYPTFLATIAGSIPTVKELILSTQTGVPFGQSAIALQQQDLWSKNMLCSGAPFDGLVNEFNVLVDATICKSGDVLVRFMGPRDKRAYRWVPVERFDAKVGEGFSLIGVARAGDRASSGFLQSEIVICQWQNGREYVFRKTRSIDGKQCYLERIRTSIGEVLMRRDIACESSCDGSR